MLSRPLPRTRFRWLTVSLVTLVLAAALTGCDAILAGLGPADSTVDLWTSRHVDAGNLQWASNREMSRASFDDRVASLAGRGMMAVDVEVKVASGASPGLEYALVAHENPDGRAWRLHVDLTSDQYHTLWDQYSAQGYRPLDVEGYLDDGQLRFAGIWIENVEDLEWRSIRNTTSTEYAGYFDSWRAEGYRPIDIEAYDTSSGLRFAAIWWENVDGLAWSQLRNLDRDTYQTEVDDQSANGYLMIDYERYETSDGTRYAAIWERPSSRPASQVRTNLNELGFANLWRTNRDIGYRIVDFESDLSSPDRYGGIWYENADRFRYARRSDLDDDITTYLAGYQNDNGAVETGISVAVMLDGTTIYRRGFGNADDAAGKVAHAETVYGFASVSKVIGGTLAALLEAGTTLRDGTSYSFDMTDPTSDYLGDDGMPSFHQHTLEQLVAHLGCIPHYSSRTTPGIDNQRTNFATAKDAVATIWDTGLVTSSTQFTGGCTIGATWSYSTPAFTFLAAAMEDATGKTIMELLDEEIFDPFGLDSFRVQFAGGSQVPDYERAVHYDDDGTLVNLTGCDPGEACDNTWKVLGGGIEGNAVDLARFGWQVLDARIVDATTRDDRLWASVDDGCTAGFGTCRNGIAWFLGQSGGRTVADHGGSQAGARSFLRVYPDDGLVVAILTNENDHDPSVLAGTIANVVLGP